MLVQRSSLIPTHRGTKVLAKTGVLFVTPYSQLPAKGQRSATIDKDLTLEPVAEYGGCAIRWTDRKDIYSEEYL